MSLVPTEADKAFAMGYEAGNRAKILESGGVTISRADAEIIHRMMVELFDAKDLSPEETMVLLNLSGAGGFGRPVPEHGSGP